MIKKLTEEMEKRLREPLSEGAVSPHPSKSYLSTIKAIYMFERLNEVFGVGTFTLDGEFVERVDKMVVIKGTLKIPEYDMVFSNFGGNDNKDLGDAYKGALTDAFTKIAAQHLEVGMYVFKGLGSLPEVATKAQVIIVNRLIDLTHTSSEIMDKWLKKANVLCFEDMGKLHLQKCIDSLRVKLNVSESQVIFNKAA